MSSGNKPKLEDLLKLKRLERPSEAEWAKFDEELKRKMLCRLLGETRERGSVFSLIGRRFAYASAAAFALFAAAVAPHIDFVGGAEDLFVDDSGLATATPLPGIEQSFANNVLAAKEHSGESPVAAPMNFSAQGTVRYVSSGLATSNSPAF